MAATDRDSFYVPCPACGGDVHRIARRCKHCGADLRARRDASGATGAPAPDASTPPTPHASAAAAPTAGASAAPTADASAAAAATARGATAGTAPAPPGTTAADAPLTSAAAAATGSPPAGPPCANASNSAAPPAPAQPPRPVPASRAGRRWLIAGAAALLFALGMATGILIERAGGSRRVEPDRAARSARALHVPSRPNPGFDPFDLMLPRRRAANPDDAPPPDEFAHKVADEMCAKLADCADADPSIEILCRTVASALPSGDVAAKVADGTCRYNEASAAACLDALASFDCDAPQRGPLDPFGAMLSVDAIFSCVDALRCVGP